LAQELVKGLSHFELNTFLAAIASVKGTPFIVVNTDFDARNVMLAERMLLANAGSQAAHVAQGHQVVGSGTVIVLLQDPTIEVKIAVPMTVNAFDFVTVHDANSTTCSHLLLLLFTICPYYSISAISGQPQK
jgi:hypothetical protein